MAGAGSPLTPPPLRGLGCSGLSELHGGAFRTLAQFSLGGQASLQPTCRNHPPGLVREATGVVGQVPRGSSSVSGERATQNPCKHAQPFWPHESLCEQAPGRATRGEVQSRPGAQPGRQVSPSLAFSSAPCCSQGHGG